MTQPPDTENRMSGGVGGVTNAISLPRPDQSHFVGMYCRRGASPRFLNPAATLRFFLSPRMSLIVDTGQVLKVEVCVYLGGGDIGVTE